MKRDVNISNLWGKPEKLKGNFFEHIKKGEVGEKVVREYLEQNPDTKQVIDVVDNFQYQRIGVDFLWRLPSKLYKVEVKTSFYSNLTLFVELWNSYEKRRKGWFTRSQADLLFYYFPRLGKLFCIPLDEFRQIKIDDYEDVTVTQTESGEPATKIAKLVPIKDVRKICNLKEIDVSYDGFFSLKNDEKGGDKKCW
jgi:hypothetical protein